MTRIVNKVLFPNEVNFQLQSAEVPATAVVNYISGLWNKLSETEKKTAKFYGMDKIRITYDGVQTDAEEKQEKLDKAKNHLMSLGRNGASPEDIATILSYLQ